MLDACFMKTPLDRTYRLFARGGAGLACDKDGIALGAIGLAQAYVDSKGARRCTVRPADEINELLCAA